MIWTIDDVSAFVPVMLPAGVPDQAVIDAYLARTRRRLPPPKHQGVPRYYYLWQEDARVAVACIGMPLADWQGAALAKVGSREIIGEFAGNRQFIGRKGLQLQLNPIAWLKEPTDQHFAHAQQALEELSMQALDLAAAERVQAKIIQKYQWRSK